MGLGKCGTTSLQTAVYPMLARHLKRRLMLDDEVEVDQLRSYLALQSEIPDHIVKCMQGQFISCEGLLGWDPGLWEVRIKILSRAFGDDTIVIVTLREPEPYVTACFLQISLHEGNMIYPSEYFNKKTYYGLNNLTTKFSVDDFSYRKLDEILCRNFNKPIYFKLHQRDNLKNLFGSFDISFEQDQIEQHCIAFQSTIKNKSFSLFSVRLSFFIQGILQTFGLSFFPNTMRQNRIHFQNVMTGGSANIKSRLTVRRPWRFFIQNIVDKIFRGARYELDLDGLGFDILRLKKEYEDLT